MGFAVQLLIGLIPLLGLAAAVAVRPEPRPRSPTDVRAG